MKTAVWNNYAQSPTTDIKQLNTDKLLDDETRPYLTPQKPEYILKEYLILKFVKYGIKDEIPLGKAVLKCESNYNINAYNKDDEWAGGSRGIFQFIPSTWDLYCKEFGDYWELNPYKQIECAAKMFSMGLHKHWSCYNIIYGKKNL